MSYSLQKKCSVQFCINFANPLFQYFSNLLRLLIGKDHKKEQYSAYKKSKDYRSKQFQKG